MDLNGLMLLLPGFNTSNMASPLAELLRDVKVLHKFRPSEHQAGYFVFFKKESP